MKFVAPDKKANGQQKAKSTLRGRDGTVENAKKEQMKQKIERNEKITYQKAYLNNLDKASQIAAQVDNYKKTRLKQIKNR